ncbi:TspO/MBR family protein [Aurantibacter aestuarii]|uniref:TspO protein n=1 Tax=Aurantibacter aestuarii TaxID=1266046 RepID=A0A2T1N913_9FLAO|nr:TspO/MBR family protein [Aurantibacter aestuarii]PSG88348.1 TspO protein [Aurantibacter aestuarii]
MKKLKLFIFFLLINFGGLALGSWLMGSGATSSWYLELNKAPWTPPGWVFGAAWTTIMLFFSIYLAQIFSYHPTKKLKIVFTIQVFLNIIWNYIFFNQHLISLGLITIILLTVLLFYMFFAFKHYNKFTKGLLLPCMVWLVIASSLNAYILIYN